MDAGRNITVDIGGSICTVDRERCMTNQNIDQDNMWMNMVNETHIICSSGANKVTDAANLTIYFDGAVRPLLGVTYEYTEDPTIETILPESSMVSGGRMIEVTGSYFKSIQKPLLIINSPPEDPYQSEPCDVLSNDHMVCITPEINYLLSRSRRASTCVDNCTDVTIGFKMDGVEDLLSLPDFSFKIFDDPEYFMFQEKDNIKVFEGEQLAIDGKNLNLASTAQEVFVYIGTERCNVTSLAVNQLNCNPPNSQPKGVDINGTATKNKLPEVRVRVGVLEFFIGYVEYPEDDLPIEVIAAVAAAALLLLIILIVVCIVCQRRHTNERLTVEKTKQKMESVELAIRDKLKVAFTELQTMMPEMSDIGASASIPFLSFNDYVVNMIFAGQTDHPVFLKGTVDASSNLAKGLRRFHNLLKEKKFLVVFIHTLEEERNISVRDRVNIGSLLTLALHKERHMAYLTDVLKTLLADAAEFAVEDESVKGMLRRTESVMEKMLTNWYVLNLYPFLKNCCGASIYWLCEALKQQIQIGPVDAIEYRAKYSLNDEYLMREDITHNVLTITVLTDDSSSELKAKVLDIDTVTQVKEKLLDVIYKSTGIPFSKRPSVDEVDLEWRHGRKLEGRLVLQDEDVTTIIEGRWKKINTMRNYKIPTDATMTLVKKSETANGNKQLRSPISAMNIHNEKELQDSEAASDMASSRLHRVKTNRRYEDAEGGVRSYHLLKCKTPSGNENKIQKGNFRERALTRARTFYRQRVISEVFLLQLVSTKGTIEQFLLNAFNKLLRVGEQSEQFPSAIKYMFDYLDELSNRHSINDPDVAHIWKSNSLLLKLWPNILKYPQNIFDMWVPEIVTPSLDIISQTFIDACSKMERKLGTKTPANRLLYAKEIEDYKAELVKYFHDIREMPKITDQQMEAALSEDFVSLNSTFEELTVLNELYNYASKYGDKVSLAFDLGNLINHNKISTKFNLSVSTGSMYNCDVSLIC
ncbi:plexin-A1-like [Saccoglossus kowalevskii]